MTTTRLGHYDIVEELGRGGMGVVYKGYESSLGRYVAIKVLSAAMAHDKVFVERFLREARAMATWDPLESTCRHASLSIL